MPIVEYNNKSLKHVEYAERDKLYIQEILERNNFKSTIIDNKKKCNRCLKMIDVYRYGTFLDRKSKKRYLNSVCKLCAADRTKKWSDRNPEKTKERHRIRNEKVWANRDLIYAAYGNKCACCREENKMFLTIDHVNNDGNEIRPRNPEKKRTSMYSGHYYVRIIEAGFPDDLQLLCWNCNCGRARNGGVCPHNIKKHDN